MPTKPITVLTRANVEEIMKAAEAALKPVAEQFGLVLDNKRGCFYPESCPVMFQFLVRKETEDGVVLDKMAQDFLAQARFYGLAATDLHREFTSYNGKAFRIVGLRTKARTAPIIAEDANGKKFKFAAEQVKALLDRGAAA
jgi:hypothetical protein